MNSYLSLSIGAVFLIGSLFWFKVSLKELRQVATKKEDRKVNILMIALDEGIFGVRLLAPAFILFIGICFLLNFFGMI
jgi:hypothetical protein